MHRIEGVRGFGLLVAAVLMVSAAACTPTGASSGGDTELVKSKCTMCHSFDRVSGATKDRAAWESTIARMRNAGAVMTDAEAAKIADFLARSSSAK